MTVAIVTDSAAAIPTDLVERHQISVVPMWIHLGDATIAEGERPLGEFLGDERVTTSAPAPGDFERVIRRRLDDGADAVVVLTIAASMSASYQSADGRGARRRRAGAGPRHRHRRGWPGARGAGGGRGRGRGRIARARSMAEAASVAAQVRLLGMVPHLEHLVRSGRVPGIAGWAGRALGINPLFELRDGRVKRLRPAIGSDAAIDRMVARFRRSQVADACAHVSALHAVAPDAAAALLAQNRRRGRHRRRVRERVRAGHGRPHRARAPRARVVVGTGLMVQGPLRSPSSWVAQANRGYPDSLPSLLFMVAQANRGYPDSLPSLLVMGRSGESGIPRFAPFAPTILCDVRSSRGAARARRSRRAGATDRRRRRAAGAGRRPVSGPLRPRPHAGRAPRRVRRPRRRHRDRHRGAGRGPHPADPPAGQAHVRDDARPVRHRCSCSSPTTRIGEDGHDAVRPARPRRLGRCRGHRDDHAQGRAVGEGRARSSCSPRRCARCPTSGTASPTSTRGSASATST